MRLSSSLSVGVILGLNTVLVSFAAARAVGRRLADPLGGSPPGLLLAAGPPIACYLLPAGTGIGIGSTPGTVATVLEAAGLLAGSGVRAWLGPRQHPRPR